MKEVFLSVVIPCFEEKANLHRGVLDKVKRFLDDKKYEYEVIIVDDGSKDGSAEFLRKFTKENIFFKLIEGKHTGKRGAVTSGILEAKGKFVMFIDMDQATPIEEVDKLLPFFESGEYDVVIGSRTTGGLGYPFSRLMLHDAGIILRKIIVGMPDIIDTQCGFKMFTRDSSRKIFTKLKDVHKGFREISNSAVQFGFDVELLLIAKNMGFKIKQVQVNWLYVESRRVSPVRDSIDGILNLIRIRMNKIQGLYS